MKRNRILYLIFCITTIILGITSRQIYISEFTNLYLGDFLYALLIFWGIGFLIPKTSSLKVALVSILICYLIELLQLYQANWINTIRKTTLGGLVLGYGFLWSDLICYTLGGFSGYFFEKIYDQKKHKNN